ncbi:hypothetical protein Indivirus_6_13 [Indivirus ILV1]|uniref:Uncharacterized protein n=1 Tax=Indivirus ILV1 TaxID=1977633 RepID=A0A1V0SE04_9VIRU|nr:hypothetical protein Indivirus_6_13 [Indivirus ILV1]
MNYSINDLGDCIFGYLTTVPNQPKSLTQIFEEITKSSGHRCDDLSHDINNLTYKRKFLESFDMLDTKYTNIYKLYKHGMFYLMFSNKSSQEISLEQHYHNINNVDQFSGEYIDNIMNTISPDIMFEYFFKSNSNQNNRYTQFFKEYLQYFTIEDAKRLFENYDINPETNICGTTFIKMARDSNNSELLEYLIKKKYDSKLTKLKADNLILKKNNTIVLLNNKNLESENKKIKNELKNMKILQMIPIGILTIINAGLIFMLFR